MQSTGGANCGGSAAELSDGGRREASETQREMAVVADAIEAALLKQVCHARLEKLSHVLWLCSCCRLRLASVPFCCRTSACHINLLPRCSVNCVYVLPTASAATQQGHTY